MNDRAADPDKACRHDHFEARVQVNRVTASEDDPAVIGYCADITAHCAQCGERFRWIGAQAGLRPDKPMCSADEFTLCAPLRPASADPDFGFGIPGYAITMRPSPER